MGTEIWTDGDGAEGQQQIWMARDGFVDLVQGEFLPFESHETVGGYVDEAITRGLDGVVTSEDGAVYISPAQALEDLVRNHSSITTAIGTHWRDAEQAMFASGRVDAEPRRYRLRQIVRVVEFGLPDTGALHLWLPAPLHAPGVQEVQLVEVGPSALADAWFPEAGQFYNAPILIDRHFPIPELVAEFQVTQTPQALREHRDGTLVWRRRMIAEQTGNALDSWSAQVLAGRRNGNAREIVEALLAAVEAEMTVSAAPMGPGDPVARILSTRSGDVPSLTDFLAAALNRLGFGARVGRAVAFALRDGRAPLTFPNGTGFGHAFLDWRDPETGAAGSVDLNYLQFGATGDETVRKQMQRGLYPGNLILAGRVQQSHIRFLHPRQSHAQPAPVQTEIEIERLSGGPIRP